MTQRRYNDTEVAAIFESAASQPEPARAPLPASHGLTLAELQAIGRDVGVDPARIASAANEIDARREAVPRRRDLGMPIAVGRIVELPRQLTDHEWGMLVGEFRRMFHASGKDVSSGDVRGWSNSNLQIYVEPAPNGYRLRLGTLKSDAKGFNRLGLGLTFSGWIAAALGATGAVPGLGTMESTIALFGVGAGALLYNAVRLPRWAREREDQFEEIAERVKALIR